MVKLKYICLASTAESTALHYEGRINISHTKNTRKPNEEGMFGGSKGNGGELIFLSVRPALLYSVTAELCHPLGGGPTLLEPGH